MAETTREAQYQVCLDIEKRSGLTKLGLMSNQTWHDDPKRLLFHLSRYKFVSKMFAGFDSVLEVGCADAFGTRVVQQAVKKVMAVDFDPVFVQDVQNRMETGWAFECKLHDMLEGPVAGDFDGAYSLDVLEHIPKNDERTFISNIVESLNENGVLIIGMPSIQSQVYASEPSRLGHVNCKDYDDLKECMSDFFHNVFIFSMNDEVVHTGFSPMAQYLLALCCNRRQSHRRC